MEQKREKGSCCRKREWDEENNNRSHDMEMVRMRGVQEQRRVVRAEERCGVGSQGVWSIECKICNGA